MSSLADHKGIRKSLKKPGESPAPNQSASAPNESHPVVAHHPDVQIGDVRWTKQDLGE
jgi:hypothetical protein